MRVSLGEKGAPAGVVQQVRLPQTFRLLQIQLHAGLSLQLPSDKGGCDPAPHGEIAPGCSWSRARHMKKSVLSPSQPPAPISIPLNPRRTEDQFSSVPGGGMVHCANLNAARCFKGPWMESQLILLSAIPTPSELRAAGAMSSEASRGRSPASFRSSAPRGSAFDPPAAARAPPHPAPTQETGPRRIRGSL